MRRLLLIMGMALSGLWLWSFRPAHAEEGAVVETPDINGGFEKPEVFTKYEETYRKWVKEGIELPDPFVKAKGWNPQSHPDPKWKVELVTDEEGAHSGKNYLKVLAGSVYYYEWPFSDLKLNDGDEVTMKVWVKGPEDRPFIGRLYLYGYDEEGKARPIYDDGASGDGMIIRGKATDEWKQYTGTYVVPAVNSVTVPGSHVKRVSPVLSGKDICFDDVELEIRRSGPT
ncbi:MAG: hypothetical protein V2A58_05815 [Planctomycetota bacterium]